MVPAASGSDVRGEEPKPSRNSRAKGLPGKSSDAPKPAEPPADAAVTPAVPTSGAANAAGVAVPSASSNSRVVLRASEDCWIEIRDRSGKVVLTRLLRKGESYSAPSRPGLVMTVGNAGALNVDVDGREAPGLGRAGMVRHDVPLDPERLKNGVEPPPEPAAPATPPADTGNGMTE